MGSTVLVVPANQDAQGRSVSGRNGGARKATSSNIVVMRQRIECQADPYYPASIRSINACQHAAVLQLFARVPVLFPLDWAARSQLELRFFAIHVRDSSNCMHTYRSRWGRATCLSDWAQGLNMERLRAQAPWRSHTQTP